MVHVRLSGPPASRYTTCGSRGYFCHPHHRERSFSSQKSIWTLSEDDECHLFCSIESDLAVDVVPVSEAWAVTSDIRQPFGTRGEVVARFLPPSEGSLEWHGHPVGKSSPSRLKSPPPQIVEQWEQQGRISRALGKKLRKQVI